MKAGDPVLPNALLKGPEKTGGLSWLGHSVEGRPIYQKERSHLWEFAHAVPSPLLSSAQILLVCYGHIKIESLQISSLLFLTAQHSLPVKILVFCSCSTEPVGYLGLSCV